MGETDPRPLLAGITWDQVETINSMLCEASNHQVGRTSDGYEEVRQLWENEKLTSFTIVAACELCKKCHRLAPFLFLNGNTFVAIARQTLTPQLADLSLVQKTLGRAAIGHYIAGTIRLDELTAVLSPE